MVHPKTKSGDQLFNLLFTSKKKVKGSLKVGIQFEEDFYTGMLAPHEGEVAHRPVPCFSSDALLHEVSRMFAIVKWLPHFSNQFKVLFDWEDKRVSFGFLVFVVLWSVLDAWRSRLLAVFPIYVLSHLFAKFRDRLDGNFQEFLLSHEMEGVNEGVLKVTMVQAKGLVNLRSLNKSSPYCHVYLREQGTLEHDIGMTRTVAHSLNPHWTKSTHGYSTKEESQTKASLVQWNIEGSSWGLQVPSFQYTMSIPKHVRTSHRLSVRVLLACVTRPTHSYYYVQVSVPSQNLVQVTKHRQWEEQDNKTVVFFNQQLDFEGVEQEDELEVRVVWRACEIIL